MSNDKSYAQIVLEQAFQAQFEPVEPKYTMVTPTYGGDDRAEPGCDCEYCSVDFNRDNDEDPGMFFDPSQARYAIEQAQIDRKNEEDEAMRLNSTEPEVSLEMAKCSCTDCEPDSTVTVGDLIRSNNAWANEIEPEDNYDGPEPYVIPIKESVIITWGRTGEGLVTFRAFIGSEMGFLTPDRLIVADILKNFEPFRQELCETHEFYTYDPEANIDYYTVKPTPWEEIVKSNLQAQSLIDSGVLDLRSL